MQSTFELNVPTGDGDLLITLTSGTSTHFVGANGSGKTRLAVYIENKLLDRAHRISAHRALTLNPTVAKISEGKARKGLRFGHPDESIGVGYRTSHRWEREKEATSLLNDFDFLLQVLFAEQTRTALDTHSRTFRGEVFTPTATLFQTLKEIWQFLLPHRELVIEGDDISVRALSSGKVEAEVTILNDEDSSPDEPPLIVEETDCNRAYSAAEMSDGERAIFYLIGQTLVAEKNSVLVIDEPELHVHRAIMGKLWDRLESARMDCAFVFITHDLEFSATRAGQKFVIESYSNDGPHWLLSAVPGDSGFSEELTTLLLGSRHPVLFVEGDAESLDMTVYRAAYPNWTVVSRGSCQAVVHAVSTFRANATLTRIECAGIVDADGYNDDEVKSLRRLGVFVLPVSEIENLFILPSISTEIAKLEHLSAEDASARVTKLREDILTLLRGQKTVEEMVMRHVMRQIDRTLKRIDLESAENVEQLTALYIHSTAALDVVSLAATRRAAIDKALQEQDLDALLAIADNKGMLAKAASRLRNTTLDAFKGWLSRVLLSDQGVHLTRAIKKVLPELTTP